MTQHAITVEEIAAVLRANPDFFEQHPDILLNINVTHSHGERTVSLSERQLIAARDKARHMESKLAELIAFGEENDEIAEKVHKLTLKLITSKSFNEFIDCLYLELLDQFQVPQVAVRIWDVAEANPDFGPEFQAVAPEMRQFIEAMTSPYCGAHPVYDCHQWFGERASHLKSFALMPLKGEHTFGLLLMASESAQRFYAEMGTVYLTRIAEIASACMLRHLTVLPPKAPD